MKPLISSTWKYVKNVVYVRVQSIFKKYSVSEEKIGKLKIYCGDCNTINYSKNRIIL